ncbi:MAG: diguanylate cyclase [Spirochaetales bacterium]|nr:diguanylate cyclase [Spirochaetales bacterium]
MKKAKLILFIIFCLSSLFSQEAPVLDFSAANLDRLVFLDGLWLFRENGSSDIKPKEVPGSWDRQTGNPYSRGVYLLTVIPPDSLIGQSGALFIPELSQAVEIRINGKVLYRAGDLETGRTDYTIGSVPFIFEDDMTIEVELTNLYFRSGGLVYPLRLGTLSSVQRYRMRSIFFEAFYMGILFLSAVYHLFLYINKYRNKSALFLSLTAILMILRAATTGQNTIDILMPGFPWMLDYRLEYISMSLNGVAIILFSSFLYPLKKKIMTISLSAVSGINFLFALSAVFMPIRSLSRTVTFLNINLVLAIIICIILYVHALSKHETGAKLFAAGSTIAFILAIMDILYYHGGPEKFFNLSQAAMIVFIGTQTFVLSRLYGESYKRNKQLLLMATTDSLTGIANRLKIDQELERTHAVFRRYGTGYSLIMFDIDHFKDVNDKYGHETGDEVLIELAELAGSMLRAGDILSRWGGEEFVILLPQVGLEGAAATAEKIRLAVEKHSFPHNAPLTASFSAVTPQGSGEELKDLFLRMDKLLYTAKHRGRNQVVY